MIKGFLTQNNACYKGDEKMQELTVELSDSLWKRLAVWALAHKKKVEEVVIEWLETIPELEEPNLQERYERFFKESGLFAQVSEEEKSRYKPVSDTEREELARRFSVGNPLSEAIIEERGLR